MTTLYKKMHLVVQTIFEMAKARWEAAQRASLYKLCADFQACFDEFER